MQIPRTRTWGIGLAAVTAVVSGIAVYTNGFGVRAWREAGISSATYTTAKNLVAAGIVLVIAVVVTRSRASSRQSGPISRSDWVALFVIGVIGGSTPFLMFFEGLSRASTGQAAFIHKTLVIWVALLAVPLLGEKIKAPHVAAIALLVAGQFMLIGGIADITWGTGEWLILGATLLWSIEVIVAKRVLKRVPSSKAAAARLGLGAVVLVGYGLVTGAFSGLATLGAAEWAWIAPTALTLSLYVTSWYGALERAPAVDVTAVLVFGAVITALLRTGIDGAALPSAAGLGLVTAGAALATATALRSRRPIIT
ncbi:MAG: DMT family transporter [Acidimicrobiia bacterium]|nr:DMT family transporter [Acidimicrobiia bacterium]